MKKGQARKEPVLRFHVHRVTVTVTIDDPILMGHHDPFGGPGGA